MLGLQNQMDKWPSINHRLIWIIIMYTMSHTLVDNVGACIFVVPIIEIKFNA